MMGRVMLSTVFVLLLGSTRGRRNPVLFPSLELGDMSVGVLLLDHTHGSKLLCALLFTNVMGADSHTNKRRHGPITRASDSWESVQRTRDDSRRLPTYRIAPRAAPALMAVKSDCRTQGHWAISLKSRVTSIRCHVSEMLEERYLRARLETLAPRRM